MFDYLRNETSIFAWKDNIWFTFKCKLLCFACFKEQDLYDILLSIFKSYEIYKEEICEELLSLKNTCIYYS